ncbi:MAG: hypothetical protein ABIN48_07860 [Ginsengibacter sp.]
MKTKYLLIVGMMVVLASCSSAYRNGQTPDDVYYSPAPAAETYVVKKNSRDRDSYSYRNSEEREIRRAIRDPRYRNSVSFGMGYGSGSPFGYTPYGYNPYASNPFGYNNFGYNPYNPYYGKGFYDPFGYNPNYGYNSYYNYNPYYGSYNPIYGGYYPPMNYYPVQGKVSNNTGARKYNLGGYTPTTAPRGLNNNRSGVVRPMPSAPVRTFDNRSTSPAKEKTGVGNVIRRVFTPSENRTYTPSSNNRSERSERTSPVRRFDPPARSTPPPARSTNQPPVRTFDPPAPAPSSSSQPAATSQSNSSSSKESAPVRTFRNN